VRVNDVDTDRYGRTVGEVYADNVCVGCELVREGNAWVYRKYTDDPVLYQLEAEARAARRGIWGLPESQRVPPWEWRHPGEQDPAQAGAGAPPAPSNFAPDGARAASTCGSKSFCREMASCDEARFYLYQCGVMRLDGDGDGIPCEALCR